MRVSRLFRFLLLLVSFIVISCSLSAAAGGDNPWGENPNSSGDRIGDSGIVRNNGIDPGGINNPGDTLLQKPSTLWMMFFQFLSVSTENRIVLSSGSKQKTTSVSTTSISVSTASKKVSGCYK